MVENTPAHKAPKMRKTVYWGAGIVVVLLVLLFACSYLLAEPLRKAMESNMNNDLKGYTVKLPGLHIQPLSLSITLNGLTVSQQAHPEPPVALFPVLKANIHWKEILRGRLVAEFWLDQPKIKINLKQLQAEVSSEVPIKEKGWQQAVAEIYPLKINKLTVKDAEVIYLDEESEKPLVLNKLNLYAENIRNVRSPDRIYPSSFHLDTKIFTGGYGSVDGVANFLAEPIPGIKAAFKLEKVELNNLKPLVARANLVLKNGTMNTHGEVEYAPTIKKGRIKEFTIKGMEIQYVHSPATIKAEKRRAAQVREAAEKISDQTEVDLSIDEMNIVESTVGMVNKTPPSPYRVFISDMTLRLKNFSNNFSQGPAVAKLNGKFMRSGPVSAAAEFRSEKKGPDFDLSVKIQDTQLKTMNDLLRAYGDFDVTEGIFTFVSEIQIKNDQISGYVKPFFRDIKVYDKRQDKDKDAFKKMYEMLVGGIGKLLENSPREEIATKTDISGPVENPETSTWQIIVELIKNAFIKSILPTFESEVTGSS